MSYCRFSSDDFGCDLYCYDAGGVWVTHLAANRVVGPIPKIDLKDFLKKGDPNAAGEFNEQYRAQMNYVANAEREAITLPFAGQSFEDTSLEDFYARVLYLIEVGYRVPDYVLKSIKSEMA